MRECSLEEDLKKEMTRLFKKDRATYAALVKKIEEIASSDDVDHYKNLKSPMQHLKRVHVMKSFVLTFYYDKKRDAIKFYDFDHHDNAYK